MDDTRHPAQNGQTNIDEKIGIAAALEEDADGREKEGEDDLADVAVWALAASLPRCDVWSGQIVLEGDPRRTGPAYLAVKAMADRIEPFSAMDCLVLASMFRMQRDGMSHEAKGKKVTRREE